MKGTNTRVSEEYSPQILKTLLFSEMGPYESEAQARATRQRVNLMVQRYENCTNKGDADCNYKKTGKIQACEGCERFSMQGLELVTLC